MTYRSSPLARLLASLLALVSLAAMAPAAAEAAAPAPKPIELARGASSAEVQGGIARGETARYTFVAREDQWAEVAVRSVEGNAVVKVYGPGWHLGGEDGSEIVRGEGVIDLDEEAPSWSDLLPRAGTYLIEVGSERGGAEFHLALTVRAPKDEDCQELSQAPMNACYAAIAREAEAARERSYANLEKSLDQAEKVRLAAAETAWRAYRDADCRYEAAFYEGGTLQPTIYGTCLIRLTAQRTDELELQRHNHDEP